MRRALLVLLLALAGCDCSADVPGAGSQWTAPPPLEPVLCGNVIDEAGMPVAGIEVRAYVPVGAGQRGWKEGLGTVTDDEGLFSLDLKAGLGVTTRVPLYLTVTGEWYVASRHQLSDWIPGMRKSVEVELKPAGAVVGRVIDHLGQPVEGAYAFAIPPDVPGTAERGRVAGDVTDARGAFRITGLPVRLLDIGVSAEGHLPAIEGPLNVQGSVELPFGDVVLKPGGSISGVVVTPEGQPVAGARVSAFRNPAYRNFEVFGRVGLAASGGLGVTDAEGKFEITTLAAAPHTVQAEARGHRVADATISDVRPGRTDLEFTLEPEARMELAVNDATTHRPVTNFFVSITALSNASSPRTLDEVSSRDGIFHFTASVGASYKVEISAEGYEVHIQTVKVTADGERLIRVALSRR
jgi:Carboxypeptidase regulatory-like domain